MELLSNDQALVCNELGLIHGPKSSVRAFVQS